MPYSYTEGRYVHEFPPLTNLGSDILLNPSQAIDMERNLLTLAAARSGKGAAQIVPNLRHWPHNALVIDPKGEAAELTWRNREAMGQKVYVLDPFETCNVPDHIRAHLNPLDEIDTSSPHAFRQINAMADGLVMRHSPEAGHWDGGTQQLLAGLVAHILTAPRFNQRNFSDLRETIVGENLQEIIAEMAGNNACGRLPMTGASKMTKTGSEAGHFLSGATSNTVWLDDPLIEACLSHSTFSLSELKRGKATVFLVLPFEALGDYGRFLRLFVRLALFQMMQKMPNGDLKGERCLFILDEFFSLGNIAEIEKSAGGMPGYNLHLWPFLQDLPQLQKLYGEVGAQTFFANSDAVFAYGINELVTAGYVSDAAGLITADDLGLSPPLKPQYDVPARFAAPKGTLRGTVQRVMNWETSEYKFFRQANMRPEQLEQGRNVADANLHNVVSAEWQQRKANEEAKYQDAFNRYREAAAMIGKPRISPEQAIILTKKDEARKIAPQSLMIKTGVCYKVDHKAHWET